MPSLFYPHAHWVQTGKMAVLYQNKKWCINRKHTFPSTSTVNQFEIPRSFWENSFEKFEAAPQSPSCDLVQLTPCGCRIPPEVLAGVLSRSRSVFQFLFFFSAALIFAFAFTSREKNVARSQRGVRSPCMSVIAGGKKIPQIYTGRSRYPRREGGGAVYSVDLPPQPQQRPTSLSSAGMRFQCQRCQEPSPAARFVLIIRKLVEC